MPSDRRREVERLFKEQKRQPLPPKRDPQDHREIMRVRRILQLRNGAPLNADEA